MSGAAAPPRDARLFVAALGLRDVVLMNVVAVVSLRWIARGARMGPPSLTLWILACLAFFLPLALTVSELSSRYPQQGGVYVWVRRAFGAGHGFICGWCLWVNNLFYFPSLLLFGAANLAAAAGSAGSGLMTTGFYPIAFVLAGIWVAAAINIVGLRAGRWLQNVGSAGVWIPASLLIAAGAIALVRFGPATEISAGTMVPTGTLIDTLSLWSAMCFAFSGFEITALVGQEVRDARRTIRRGILLAGIATLIFYIAGTAALLIALPASALQELSGITDAVDAVGRRLNLPAATALTGALLALNALAGTASWTAGAARVPFAAGVDRAMPRAFARLHPRFHTPHIALIVQAIVSSAIFLASLYFTIGGKRASVQEAYDILVNLTILIYFVPYLYLFAALVRLRTDAGTAGADEMRVPGGTLGLWLIAATGFIATAVSLALTFVPPPGSDALSYEANLLLQAAVIVGVGALLYKLAQRA
jgi:glutamate:GABA antiporter